MNAMTYITRRCVRNCSYCSAAKVQKNEMNVAGWIEAFSILKEMGVEFNLILGNESWVLGEKLLPIMKTNKVPYALYTTAPPVLFNFMRQSYFESGIDNISCGIDYLPDKITGITTSTILKSTEEWKKSMDGLTALLWTKKSFPKVDTQATITISKRNVMMISKIVEYFSNNGIFTGLNFIHWNIDGKFDFFPHAHELIMQGYMLDMSDIPILEDQVSKTLGLKNLLLQVPQYLKNWKTLVRLKWHCQGDPYGGPTIDSDGTLRVCGYRRGNYTPNYTIFDLTNNKLREEWKEAVWKDAQNCPGCAWSYPWTYKFWKEHDPEFGKKVFINHAAKSISEDKWSKRNLE